MYGVALFDCNESGPIVVHIDAATGAQDKTAEATFNTPESWTALETSTAQFPKETASDRLAEFEPSVLIESP